MPISRTTIAGTLAGAVLLLSAGAAFATPGQATASVNVRSGPGTSYGIVDSLYPGENVDVQQCRGSWCYVEHSGPDGWVSANFLSTGEGDSAPPPVYYDDQPPPVYYDEPEYVQPPVFITPPFFQQRPHYRYDGGGPFHHGSFPPPGGHPGFPGGPGHMMHPHPQGGQNFCATNPAACMGNGPGHRHQK
jgi:hypothetical protein